MAATAWVLYNKVKKNICSNNGGTQINLGTTAMKMKLTNSASNAETLTISTFASITGEISARGGYAAGGRAVAGLGWTVGASAKSYKLTATDLVFTASGSTLVNCKYAVIGVSGGRPVCWSKLTTAQFNVTSPNTLTVQINAGGVFELH
jgi:hypothetical protein